MIIGMIPMVFALGEGAEQNAPLGRARDRRPDGATVASDTVFRADGMQRAAGTREGALQGALQGEALIGECGRVDRPHRA